MTHLSRRPAHEPLPREFYIAQFATLLFALSLTLIIPIIPLYITDKLNAAEHWIGTATLIVAFSAVATRIPGGALSDVQGRRKFMLIGAAIMALAGFLYAFSMGIGVFLLARALTGVGLGLFTTASKALAADLAPASRRGEVMGYSNAAFSLAAVLSPIVSEGLKNAVSFQAVFLLSGVLALATFSITSYLPKTRPARTAGQTARRDITDVLHERGLWAAGAMIIGLAPIMAVMFTFFPLLAERKNLLGDAPHLLASISIGLALSLWSLTDTIVEPIAGRVSDRIGRLPVAIPGVIIAIIGVVLLSQAAGTRATYVAIVVMTIGWGSTRAIADSAVQDAVPPALRGMGAAILYTCFDLGVGFNAQVLGTVIDGSDFTRFFRVALVVVVAISALGLALSANLKSYDQRHPEGACPLPELTGD